MIRTPTILFCLCSVTMLAGCGGDVEPPIGTSNAANTRANNAPAPGSQVGPSSNQPGSAPANVATANNAAQNPLVTARNRKIEAMRQAGSDPNAPKTDLETLLKQSTRPAPENSEFSVALTDIVVERRRFLNHPVLSQVEKVTDGGRSTIKLTTTDGRTIDLPGNAIQNLSVAASASILKAAGIQLPPSQPSDRRPGAANKN